MKHFSPYRYSGLERTVRTLHRRTRPVPKSPWTDGHVDDIAEINLVPPQRLQAFFSRCIPQLRILKGVEIGDYLEFGVFNGNSIGSMHCARNACRASDIRLFGFDAFQGLPEGSEQEDGGVWKAGYYSCSFADMQSCLRQRGIDPDDITWVNGWYDQTLNDGLVREFNICNIGIVFIDCDTYSSARTVLNFVAPLITSPAIICLDDWKLNNLDIKGEGEYRAFNEFLEANAHLRATRIRSYSRKSESFLIEPK